MDKASDFESEDWGFVSLCGRNFWIQFRKEVEDPKRAPKREKWSQETIITQRTKDGKSETTEHIEGHFTLQLIHWLKRNRTWKVLKAQRKGCLLPNRKIGGSNPSVVVNFNFLVEDPNHGSQMKKIQPHQFDLIQLNKLDWSSTDINFEQRKRLTHWDDSKHCVSFYSSPKSFIAKKNRNGKDLNKPHSLMDKASDFESEDWGFVSLCGRNFWIHCREEVEDPKRAPKRKKWSQETIITQRTKDGKSETTEHIEGHFTLQLIHWLKRNRTWKVLKAQRKGCLLPNRKIGGSNPSVVVNFNFLVEDPNHGSQMKKIQPHQFDLIQLNKLDWSSTDINFEQRKRLTHWDDSKHCVSFYSSPKSFIAKKNRNGKDLNKPHSLMDKASDFESEDWGFVSLCGRNFWIHCREEVEDPKRAPKRKKWSQETIITQRTKDGKSETTEHIEGHFTLQLIHWLKRNRTWKVLKAQRKGCLLPNRKIGGSNPSVVVNFNFLVEDPNHGSQMKKIQPHQFDLIQLNKLDWSSTDINFEQRKRLTHWDDSKHCVSFYSSPKSFIAKKNRNGKALNEPHSVTDKASDFDSEDWAFEFLFGRNFWIHCQKGWISQTCS